MRIHSILFILISFLVMSGCAQQPVSYYPAPAKTSPSIQTEGTPSPQPQPIPQPPVKRRTKGPAETLYSKARGHMDTGNYKQAEIAMERALRIEPRNGYYWHTLAQIKYRMKQYSQSIQLSLKSKSMAGGDLRLSEMNSTLIRDAQLKQNN